MAMDRIHNVPNFHYKPRIEKSLGNPKERRKEEQQGNQKKKKKKSDNIFEDLADSLGQYNDEPFQISG